MAVYVAARRCALIILPPFSTMTPNPSLPVPVALSGMMFTYCNKAALNQPLFVDLCVATQCHVKKNTRELQTVMYFQREGTALLIDHNQNMVTSLFY